VSAEPAPAGLRPAALLFDLDGTLADSFAAIARALNLALADHGLPGHDLAWVKRHVGRGAVELLRDAVGDDPGGERLPAVGQRFGEHYRAIYLDGTPPLPGAAAVLSLVHARTGGRVAVVSNKYASLCRGWLEHWGLAPYVTVVLGPDATGVHKPHPGAVLPALAALAVAPGDALLVGDMAVDVVTGQAAGIPMLGLRSEDIDPADLLAAGAVAVVDRLADLPDWLAGHGLGWR
jgi:phosphoglycolate phosphatase